MSRFFSDKYSLLTPYTPGEQPQDRRYIKLNTNESPYPPSPVACRLAREEANSCMLYSDPQCRSLRAAAAEYFGIGEDAVVFGNGSDEVLNFAFSAFCDNRCPAIFPDISYGFYPVFAEQCGVLYRTVPLREDYSINPRDYFSAGGTVFIANPNAPTGMALGLDDIEAIVRENPDNVVVIDEAYVDFGAQSAVPLTQRYDNLLVVQTFSKSRSLAGARLGIGIGSAELIRDLETLRYSVNPYNINRMTMAAGVGALADREYFDVCRSRIIATRERTAESLRGLGFTVLPSSANFLFAKSPDICGAALYKALKARGILVRHFTALRLDDWNRITVGSEDEMSALLDAISDIIKEEKS